MVRVIKNPSFDGYYEILEDGVAVMSLKQMDALSAGRDVLELPFEVKG